MFNTWNHEPATVLYEDLLLPEKNWTEAEALPHLKLIYYKISVNWKSTLWIEFGWYTCEIKKTCFGLPKDFKGFSLCLEITEKVSFNIASEASYVYILSRQKFIKYAKNGQFWRVLENLLLAVKQCYQIGHF